VVPLSLLPDSNVRTIGYTGTIQALGLLRDAVAGRDHTASADQTWEDAADGLEALLPAAEELAEGLLPQLRGVTAFDVVGSGVNAGTALQGALLLREVCKLPATGYETYQYLHGPVEAAAAGRVVVAIGGPREAKLAADLAAAGSTVLLVEAGTSAPAGQAMSYGGPGIPATFAVTAADPLAQAVLAILPLQTITWQLAEDLGLPDGEFLYHQDDTKVG
jgi:glucosamine--fructose-6-phosphate aminotransferase (isomerizing)